jgi:hypothetical protein
MGQLCAETDKPLSALIASLYEDNVTLESWETFGIDFAQGDYWASQLPDSNEVANGFEKVLDWSTLPAQTALDSVDDSGMDDLIIGCINNGTDMIAVQGVLDAN